MRKRRTPAWLWPALISMTLGLIAFLLVMILIPRLADSYISINNTPRSGSDAEQMTTSTTQPATSQEMTLLVTTAVEEPSPTVSPTPQPVETTTSPKPSPTPTPAETKPVRIVGDGPTQRMYAAIKSARHAIVTFYLKVPARAGTADATLMFSGVVVSADGKVVTAGSNLYAALTYSDQLHADATVLAYLSSQSTPFQVELIAHDRNTDVMLLQLVDAPPLRPIEMAPGANLMLGDPLLVLGGADIDMVDLSVSPGNLIGINRRTYFENGMETGMLRTSALVTPILSGAPLLDEDGYMVGLVNTNVSRSYSDMYSYALPVDVLIDVLDYLELRQTPPVERKVWLGITVFAADEYAEIAALRDYPEGLYVSEVLPDGPAASSSLHAQDVIITIDDEPVLSYDQLASLLAGRRVGDRVKVVFYRTTTQSYLTTYLYLREVQP